MRYSDKVMDHFTNPRNVGATYLHDDYAVDWQIGVNQDLSKNVELNVNYRYHDEDHVTFKGIGAGVVYKF